MAGVEEIETFKAVVREVAASEKLPFYDGSARTEAVAEFTAKQLPPGTPFPIARPKVNIAGRGKDMVGFSAGNFKEAADQIVMGFSNGLGKIATRDQRAREMSDSVVAALQRHWQVHEVNVETTGAFPLEDCATSAADPTQGNPPLTLLTETGR